MFTVTEDLISMLAPNAAAVTNAKKISQKGGFVELLKSEDGLFYMGECKGSGKSNYSTYVDAVNPDQPVFSCSCPSRQFPCKHGLALLMEILADKEFGSCEVPEAVIEKRDKRDAREEKKKSGEPPKVNKAALAKKMKKQLEGLDLAEQCVQDLISAGFGAISGNSLTTYKDLAKQLGDYYLPGPQVLLKRIILELEAVKEQPEQESERYAQMVRYCIQLHALIKKVRQFFGQKLDEGQIEVEDSTLYDSIGNVWNTAQLKQLGLYKENSTQVQLAFAIYFDEARGEYIDTGYWAELGSGTISRTINYRPLRALKRVKQDDSTFGAIDAKEMYCYPGDLNKRVRWEEFQLRDVTEADLADIIANAHPDIAAAAKTVKNQIKNTLSDHYAGVMIRFSQIARSGEDYVLVDDQGKTLLLKDMEDPVKDQTTELLEFVPDKSFLSGQTLFGMLYYDMKSKRMAMQPYSIITKQQIIRLLY